MLIVTGAGPGKTLGAVYRPLAEMVPTMALPPTTVLTSHWTAWFVVPETVALNCAVCPGRSWTLAGVIVTVTWTPTLTIRAEEAIAPGSGFDTVSCTDIPFWEAVVVPVAVNRVADTNFVVNACPPNITLAPLTNFVPAIVIEKLPTGTDAGETAVTVGTGFSSETLLLPESVLSDTEVASTLTELGLGRAAGAV